MENLTKNQKIIVYIIIGILACFAIYYAFGRNNTTDYEEINNIVQEEENILSEDEEEMIVVHIVGQVKNPGIVKIKYGARIADVIKEAGGSLETADLNKINLAYIVEDGQKIYIPSKIETENIIELNDNEYITEENGYNEFVNNVTNSTKVNINSATKEELETLPGVGESTAQKIINYREENGKFKSIEDIKNVSGIGEAKFNNIKQHISIK